MFPAQDQRFSALLLIRRLKVIITALFLLSSCGDGGSSEKVETITQTAPTEYLINTKVSDGGSVIPSNAIVVAGGSASFKVQPSPGYILDKINGCAGILNESQYHIYNIAYNCTIQATFRSLQKPPEGIIADVDANQANISWISVEGAEKYNVYFSNKQFSNSTDLQDSTIILTAIEPTIIFPFKKSYNNYYVRVSAVFGEIELFSTEQKQITSNFKSINEINDTSITYCLTSQLSIDECKSEFSKRQDGSIGRDAQAAAGQLTKLGIGTVGFDFSKISRNGETLANQNEYWADNGNESDGSQWSCARDNVTGLVWEVKQPSGINSRANTFSWFDSSPSTNGGDPGFLGDNSCGLHQCNTSSYIEYLNKIQFCGSTSWRLPTRAELVNIVMNSGTAPRLDPLLFPDVLRDTSYWTSSTYHPTNLYAWAISMNSGIVFWEQKKTLMSVRLVHSN